MLRMMQLTSEKRFTPTRWHLDTGYFGILNQSAEQSPFAFATNPREERIFSSLTWVRFTLARRHRHPSRFLFLGASNARGLSKPFAFFVSRTFTIESHSLPWRSLEFSFPCHGKDRAFKSRRERLGRVWRNWQTRLAQAQLSRKRLYRFKSDHPHCRLGSIGRAIAS